MLKQTVRYKNFNNEEVTEDFYFNFTMLEMVEQVEIHQVEKKMNLLTNTNDGPGAYMLFKGIVLDAYGIKSDDGRKFDKSPAIRHDFETSAAISELIIGFLKNVDAGIAFIRGVLPEEMLQTAVQAVEAKRAEEAKTPDEAGLHLVPQHLKQTEAQPPAPVAPVAPTPVEDHTAASEVERERPGTPLDRGVEMSTAEKRQYTAEELDAIQGVPGTVPPAPSQPVGQSEYSDAEVLAMSPQELASKDLLLRAYALKTQS